MYHVTLGSDTYGRVKKVGTTPIVTRFGMISALPLFPLESFYFAGFGASSSRGVPLFAQIRSTEVRGVPLARIDRVSVVMAYLRGLFGTMAVLGVIGTFMPFMMWITGERLDGTAILIAKWAGLCLAIGVVGGSVTYAVPLMTKREREIRRVCGTIFGIALDPAHVRRDYAQKIANFINGFNPGPDGSGLARELGRTRVRIALGEPRDPLEDETDDLLNRIRIEEGRGGA